jgi:hypothetical protein
MAKITLYLHAGNSQPADIVARAGKLASHPLFEKYKLQLAVMTPRSSDLLAVPPDSDFLAKLDVVLEIVFPVGRAMEGVQSELYEALIPVLELAEKADSYLLSGYHRTFQESGPKPVRYHYLMYRRQDYNRADYLDYYVHSHYQFGVATPLADYYQYYLDQEGGQNLAELFGVKAMAADNISELRFDKVEDYLFSDVIREVGPAAGADEELFVDREICQSFSMDVLLDTRIYS